MNVFIVGSPRSGTTLLADTLDHHPKIASWNEPNFVLDRFYRGLPDDCRNAGHASPEVMGYLQKEFNYFRKKRTCDIVVDKSPSSSLKIPFLKAVFPEARFIHMLRDGRDATLSINAAQRWSNTKQGLDLFSSIDGLKHAAHIFRHTIGRQTLLRHKLALFWFEAGGFQGLIDPRKQLHRTRWGGRRFCWGPRFSGWPDVVDQLSLIEVNATLWTNCVNAILDEKQFLGENVNYLEVRYESFVQRPVVELSRIFSFLGLTNTLDMSATTDAIHGSNFNKWRDAMTQETLALVGPILGPTLQLTGYEHDDSWYC